jgi:hypothetical protein
MLVYRVEDNEEGGPYRGDNYVDGMGAKHSGPDHPSPYGDGIGSMPEYMVCGFASLQAFEAWFDGDDRWDLKVNGFRLCVFDAETVVTGRKQVTLRRSTARLIETLDPVTLKPKPFNQPHAFAA